VFRKAEFLEVEFLLEIELEIEMTKGADLE